MGDDKRGLSRTTTVIVAVCAAVAGLLLVLFAFNFLRSRRRRPTAPLPPVQPLAHRRLTKYESYYDTPLLHSASRPPSSVAPESPLPVPVFPAASASASSISSSSRSDPNNPAPPPRPASSASVASYNNPALSHFPSRTTLRGVPHAPHNNVQIVMPAPLAPSLQRSHSRTSIRRTDSDRISLVDKWVPVPRDTDQPSATPTPTRTSLPAVSAVPILTSPHSNRTRNRTRNPTSIPRPLVLRFPQHVPIILLLRSPPTYPATRPPTPLKIS
ncbi:hypothetical protein DXG03_006101 [Asterophora parasitica]|uniref:Uncharacterized protein n=1 Tax=Asterophora parasitica TaxID=117018 RepID=A0A9P7GJI7_9AGAR|nr:hypothetical protein DXG03_006101 [Asterophora parasitica]